MGKKKTVHQELHDRYPLYNFPGPENAMFHSEREFSEQYMLPQSPELMDAERQHEMHFYGAARLGKVKDGSTAPYSRQDKKHYGRR